MGYTTSTIHGIEVPDSSEANDVPEDIGKVVTALEGGSIIRRLTGAQIAALTAPQKPAGTYFHNTTTGRLQVSDGSTVADVGTWMAAWSSYTPTLRATTTDPTGWTETGYYTQIGKTVIAKFALSAGGSATAGSGYYRVALPVSARSTMDMDVSQHCVLYDYSTGSQIYGSAYIAASDTANCYFSYATSATTLGNVGSSTPWTWAASDAFRGQIIYEAG